MKDDIIAQHRHRLATKLSIPESRIEPELVPLMLIVEQSEKKIELATEKINASVKPVVYENNYGYNTSAWTVWWGNLSTGIGRNIVPILLIMLASLLSVYAIHKYLSDEQLIKEAQADMEFINQHFVRDQQGNFYIPKQNYKVLSDGSGIKLNIENQE